jgi:acetyl esterase/lipase
MGFSAGGHLAATTATNAAQRSYPAVDDADQFPCRPDFVMLIYPAYLTVEGQELQLAPELKVAAQTPPTLLVHAGDDGISATNSVAFYLALKRAGVRAELHIYPTGGHGYGLRPSAHAVSKWPDRAEHWLAGLGLLRKP